MAHGRARAKAHIMPRKQGAGEAELTQRLEKHNGIERGRRMIAALPFTFSLLKGGLWLKR